MNLRQRMVDEIKKNYGLDSPQVLSVMLQIPREKFVAKLKRVFAYRDGPVDIGYGQTISQPYTVAFMTHLLVSDKASLRLRRKGKVISGKIKNWRVLEIGTGSGYQAAILSKLVRQVYTVEIIPQLAEKAKRTLRKLRFNNVFVKSGSGEWGWSEYAPYDAIMVTAGLTEKVPQEIFEQLKVGGVLIAPIGKGYDKVMTRYNKLKNGKTKKREFGIFHFVPFVGEKN
ncbi:protein-L-isoaspartate O-methyltransferase [Candidatus Woesebacteria bacterium RBG_16_34_12]|uniref:Protein-L-isoaspartate O-methyltransferase n=1 Tax=Candidatus Woesebacteria bacterium RBG_16_34_12 TaxID=1802480 RepID=A0A1F7XAT0_9BACT|nr:MAG: protein-L-isoaspartate O-methyltransferase [Candidatus Woesebacteria bacterium RBG_16_34_12]